MSTVYPVDDVGLEVLFGINRGIMWVAVICMTAAYLAATWVVSPHGQWTWWCTLTIISFTIFIASAFVLLVKLKPVLVAHFFNKLSECLGSHPLPHAALWEAAPPPPPEEPFESPAPSPPPGRALRAPSPSPPPPSPPPRLEPLGIELPPRQHFVCFLAADRPFPTPPSSPPPLPPPPPPPLPLSQMVWAQALVQSFESPDPNPSPTPLSYTVWAQVLVQLNMMEQNIPVDITE